MKACFLNVSLVIEDANDMLIFLSVWVLWWTEIKSVLTVS